MHLLYDSEVAFLAINVKYVILYYASMHSNTMKSNNDNYHFLNIHIDQVLL